MSITLEFDVKYSFEVNASYEEVFSLLADIPRASSFHPTLERVIDLGGGNYRWEMKRYGTEKYNFQTVYTCVYESDVNAGTVTWRPSGGEGNAVVSGSFKVFPMDNRTQVDTHIVSSTTLPFPAVMKSLAFRMIAVENKKLTEIYVKNLIEQLGGGRILKI